MAKIASFTLKSSIIDGATVRRSFSYMIQDAPAVLVNAAFETVFGEADAEEIQSVRDRRELLKFRDVHLIEVNANRRASVHTYTLFDSLSVMFAIKRIEKGRYHREVFLHAYTVRDLGLKQIGNRILKAAREVGMKPQGRELFHAWLSDADENSAEFYIMKKNPVGGADRMIVIKLMGPASYPRFDIEES
jgi:hypothetical protein